MPGKLGRTSKERNALLRNQASQLLWYGKIETTAAKAKELRSYVEKLITKAVNTYDDNIEFEVTKTDKKGKEFKATNIKDGPKKLAARRAIMAKTYDLQEIKGFAEKVTKERFGGIPGTCTKPIPVGDIPGIQQAGVCQLLPSRIAFPKREEQCATGT